MFAPGSKQLSALLAQQIQSFSDEMASGLSPSGCGFDGVSQATGAAFSLKLQSVHQGRQHIRHTRAAGNTGLTARLSNIVCTSVCRNCDYPNRPRIELPVVESTFTLPPPWRPENQFRCVGTGFHTSAQELKRRGMLEQCLSRKSTCKPRESNCTKSWLSPGSLENERLSCFLDFVVEKHLEHRDGEIKESVIAVEVFGRRHGSRSRNRIRSCGPKPRDCAHGSARILRRGRERGPSLGHRTAQRCTYAPVFVQSERHVRGEHARRRSMNRSAAVRDHAYGVLRRR